MEVARDAYPPVESACSVDFKALLWLVPKLAIAIVVTMLTAWLAGAQTSFMVLLEPDTALVAIRPWVWVLAAAGLSAALAAQASDALGYGRTAVRTALLAVSVAAPVALIFVECQWVLVPAAMASEGESNASFFLSGASSPSPSPASAS